MVEQNDRKMGFRTRYTSNQDFKYVLRKITSKNVHKNFPKSSNERHEPNLMMSNRQLAANNGWKVKEIKNLQEATILIFFFKSKEQCWNWTYRMSNWTYT